jgi:hypothetical protein
MLTLIKGEAKDLASRFWTSFKDVVTKKTVQIAVLSWVAGVVCDRYGCDKSQLAAWGLGALAMLQQASADFGKNRSPNA